MQIDLPYLMQDVDRHGNVRLYVRRKGLGKVRLRLAPGSPKFMDEYKAALDRLSEPKKAPNKPQHVGTLGWLAEQYYKSPQFAVIDKRQQRVRQLVMRALLDEPTKEGSKYRFYDCPISAVHIRPRQASPQQEEGRPIRREPPSG